MYVFCFVFQTQPLRVSNYVWHFSIKLEDDTPTKFDPLLEAISSQTTNTDRYVTKPCVSYLIFGVIFSAKLSNHSLPCQGSRFSTLGLAVKIVNPDTPAKSPSLVIICLGSLEVSAGLISIVWLYKLCKQKNALLMQL